MVANLPIDKRVRRWGEQRWLIDANIRAQGVETTSKAIAGGPDSLADFQSAARRIKRFDDMDREFAAQARKRQARAEAFEADGRLVAARESYMTAALLWSAAQWPIFEINDTVLDYEEQMNHCYGRFMRHMNRPILRADVPFGDKILPAYLHLPYEPRAGERFPAVIAIGGLDGTKETMVFIYGDRYLERGMAVLALDGPGQGEALTRGIPLTATNHGDAAEAAFDWLSAHPAIDPTRIAIRGNSFGSYFGTVAAARLGSRIKAFAAAGICQEPGANTILNHAPPSYKMRLMFMAGYEDEGAFDRFMTGFDLRTVADRIVAPYMILAGGDDALSPVECTIELFQHIRAPKRLVIYEGSNHGIRDGGSAQNGEEKTTVVADWLRARIDDKPFESETIWIDAAGRARREAFADPPARSTVAAVRSLRH
jgi:pimeloyl-ACP methyl ester carboxylesterase